MDRSLNSALGDARDAMINAPVDTLVAYGQQIPASQRVGALMAPYSLRLMPMYMLAMLKHVRVLIAETTHQFLCLNLRSIFLSSLYHYNVNPIYLFLVSFINLIAGFKLS